MNSIQEYKKCYEKYKEFQNKNRNEKIRKEIKESESEWHQSNRTDRRRHPREGKPRSDPFGINVFNRRAIKDNN